MTTFPTRRVRRSKSHSRSYVPQISHRSSTRDETLRAAARFAPYPRQRRRSRRSLALLVVGVLLTLLTIFTPAHEFWGALLMVDLVALAVGGDA